MARGAEHTYTHVHTHTHIHPHLNTLALSHEDAVAIGVDGGVIGTHKPTHTQMLWRFVSMVGVASASHLALSNATVHWGYFSKVCVHVFVCVCMYVCVCV
jgi:hypothetical protein